MNFAGSRFVVGSWKQSALAAAIALLGLPLLSAHSAAEDAKPESKPPAAAAPETVIVTGKKPTKEERNRIVWNFVYAHAKLTPKIDQLARWAAPVCPEVLNLPPAYAEFVVKRIEEVAKAIGASVVEPCRRNIEIAFTSDPQAFIDGVAKKNPKMLGFHFIHDLQRVARVTRPIQAWYATATSNGIATSLDDPYHSPPTGTAGSRISHGLISVFANILIVVDAKKVAGSPIGPIADYLAMLSLSQADAPDACNELPSILDLMSSGCADVPKPDALTATDKSYLEALYAMEADEIGSLQKSAIANYVRRDTEEH